jgi:hypothetical protein
MEGLQLGGKESKEGKGWKGELERFGLWRGWWCGTS